MRVLAVPVRRLSAVVGHRQLLVHRRKSTASSVRRARVQVAASRLSRMATISFARGVPAPECLPVEELADCARAAVERDGADRPQLRAGRTATRRCASGSRQRHGVEPAQVLVTNGSLQGLSLLAGLLLERRSARPRRGADLRSRAAHRRPTRRRSPCRADGRRTASTRTRSSLPAAFLYTIPTFQNPSGRTLSLERRRRLAELARDGRLLVLEDDPYALVRFEGERAAEHLRARRWRGCRLLVLLLEDRRARPPRRLPRRSCRPDRPPRGARRPDVPDTGAAAAGDRARVPPPRPARAERRAGGRAARARAATRCSSRSRASCPRARAGAGRRAATSSGSIFPRGTDAGRAARPRRAGKASRSCEAATSSRPARAAAAQRGLPTASSRSADVRAGIARLAGLLREPLASSMTV